MKLYVEKLVEMQLVETKIATICKILRKQVCPTALPLLKARSLAMNLLRSKTITGSVI
jgi:hypothetical protein